MAQRILGVDLGAYSVKLAELEIGFRQTQVHLLREVRLLDALPDETALDRATRTLADALGGIDRHGEVVAVALGQELMLRLVDVPFQDARKIDQVIGFELESQILGELDGMVVDQVLSEKRGDGARVLAVGVDRERLQALIASLSLANADPRYVGAAVLSYAALAQRLLPPPAIDADAIVQLEGAGASTTPERAIDAIIDLGHATTRVAIVEEGRTLFSRGILRGGADVTTAIAETYRLDEPAAERAKHAQGELVGPEIVDPARRKLDGVLREALRPLVRELRQTIAAARAQGTPMPRRLAVIGGASKLRGLPEWLEAELALPLVELELPTDLMPLKGADFETRGAAIPGIALGMALGVAAGAGTQVNLRKGELAFRSDYAYLRGKARYLGAAVMALLACVALNAYASLRALRKESEVLEARLKRETTELFGAPKLDGKAVSEELRRGPQNGIPPVPVMTAYDTLDEISRHLPPKDQIHLDVLELDIKPKKSYLKATAASAKEIDTLVDSLKQIECFGEIVRGKVASTTGPASGSGAAPTTEKSADGKETKIEPEKHEMKQFTLDIETTCQ